MGRRPLKGRATTNTTPEHPEAPAIVAFDFDGTITARDSYTAFLRWRAGPWRYWVGIIRLAPSALAYMFHRDRGRIKAEATKEFLHGVPRETLEEEANVFAREMAQSLLRSDAVSTWPTLAKLTAEKKALARVITAPLGRPVVPEV